LTVVVFSRLPGNSPPPHFFFSASFSTAPDSESVPPLPRRFVYFRFILPSFQLSNICGRESFPRVAQSFRRCLIFFRTFFIIMPPPPVHAPISRTSKFFSFFFICRRDPLTPLTSPFPLFFRLARSFAFFFSPQSAVQGPGLSRFVRVFLVGFGFLLTLFPPGCSFALFGLTVESPLRICSPPLSLSLLLFFSFFRIRVKCASPLVFQMSPLSPPVLFSTFP